MKVEHGLFTSDIITLTAQDVVDLLEGKVVKGDGKEIHYERSQALTKLNKAAEDMGEEL